MKFTRKQNVARSHNNSRTFSKLMMAGVLLSVLFCSIPARSQQEKQATLPLAHLLQETTGGDIASMVVSPTGRRVYFGRQYSYAPQRRNLGVLTVGDDGQIAGEPRFYAEKARLLPKGSPHSSVVAILPHPTKRKLYVAFAVTSAGPNDDEGHNLSVYDVDAQGEPTGTPRSYRSGNPNRSLLAMAVHPKLPLLYMVGWGGAGVYVYKLNESGEPTGEPLAFPVGGQGKFSVSVSEDGTKLYLGTYPSVLEVVDLGADGLPTGPPRSFSVPNGPAEYLQLRAAKNALYFKGAGGSVSYFSLDAKGEPVGGVQTVPNLKVQTLAASGDRLAVAADAAITDAITGEQKQVGTKVQEYTVGPNGAPEAMLGQSQPFIRRTATFLNLAPGVDAGKAAPGKPAPVVALISSSMGNGFLGNRFAGLNARVTLLSAKANSALQPVALPHVLGTEGQYLRFAVSAWRNTVYATVGGTVQAYSLRDGKSVPTALSGVTPVLAVDDEARVLYAAHQDGTVTVWRIGDDGMPVATGLELPSGLTSISVLIVNPRNHLLYALGAGGGQPVSKAALPGGGKIVPIVAGAPTTDAVLDAARGRIYAVSTYNGNENIWVWQLAPAGTLLGAAQKYADGFTPDQGRSLLSSVRVDVKRNKLYAAGAPEQAGAGIGAVIVYDLDASGDPTGTPRLVKAPSPTGHVDSIELSPGGQWLYQSGWGMAAVYAYRLNAGGEPTGEVLTWPMGPQGKMQLTVVPAPPAASGKDAPVAGANPATNVPDLLLAGTYPSTLEVLRLQPNGEAEGGLQATLSAGGQNFALGVLQPGATSAWINLDAVLKDNNGELMASLGLAGGTVAKADIKIETALMQGGKMTPLRTMIEPIEGNSLAFFLPRYGQDDTGHLADAVHSSAERYRRYLALAQKHALKPDERPKQFVVANGLIGLDSSREALDAGLQALAATGHNTVQIWGWGVPPASIHESALRYGFNRFRDATYNPPSYFDYVPEMETPAYLDKWADTFKDGPIAAMGTKGEEMALFHLADEPGWYYPGQFNDLKSKPERLAIFRDYLKSKGMTPELLGVTSWEQVEPIGLSAAKTLPTKRLLFWTTRFYAESLSKSFAAATAALQRRLSPKILTTTNLNNWPGRFFVPSPGAKVANNSDTGPDAAEGMPDWFDLGRKKAVTAIWTEDWFGDASAQNWSFYTDMMRCAAREGGVEYGGYVVGQSTGTPEGGTYKIMALMGHGAKALDPYTFGPLPAFGDAWSDSGEVRYQSLADGLKMLGRAERLMYPGRPRNGTVTILFPQASQVWDSSSALPLYQAQLWALHQGLTNAHYPVDFVDDFGVEGGELKKYGYRVLYVTAPNLSLKAQGEILDWAQAGGTVVLFPGAAVADEYNEPTDLLWKAAQANRQPVPRLAPASAETAITLADARLGKGTLTTASQISPLTPDGAKSLATFSADKAAVVAAVAGKGRVIAFGYWPTADDEALVAPSRIAEAAQHVEVSIPGIEATLLESDKGIAVTLLNWTRTPQPNITVTIHGTGKFKKVSSIEKGALIGTVSGDSLTVKLPLKTVDVLMVE